MIGMTHQDCFRRKKEMKRIIALLGLFLLIDITFASAIIIYDEAIGKPPMPIEIFPIEKIAIDEPAHRESGSSSTMRQIRNYKLEIKMLRNYVEITNKGYEKSYRFELEYRMPNEQFHKISFNELSPMQKVRFYIDTHGYNFYINDWSD